MGRPRRHRPPAHPRRDRGTRGARRAREVARFDRRGGCRDRAARPAPGADRRAPARGRPRRPPRSAAAHDPRCGLAARADVRGVEIGDVSRFPSARKLVGYSGLVPRVSQSGESSRTGRLSRAGSPLLRWAAVEAAQHAWREQNPWHRLYVDVRARHGNGNAAKSAVARKVLIAVWHVWSRQEPFKPAAACAAAPIVPASSGQPLAA